VSSAAGDRYTVRRWTGLLALGSEVGLVLVVGLVFGVLQDRMVVNLITIAVILVLAALAFDRATLAFRADGSGVTWSRPTPRVLISTAGVRRLPWSSICDLEVVEGRSVRARLRPEAPLPGWMRGRINEPADPEAADNRTVVAGDAPGVREDQLRLVVARAAPNVHFVGNH